MSHGVYALPSVALLVVHHGDEALEAELSHSPGFSREVQAAIIVPFALLSPRGLHHQRSQARLRNPSASDPL